MADDERKIIIDEGWKAQVQREKEEASKRGQEQASARADAASPLGGASLGPAGGAPASPQSAAAAGPDADDLSPFMALVGSLATQAMFALGVIAQQGAQQVQVDLAGARYVIDMLQALKEKTQGNLTAEEAAELTQAVNELQQVYVMRAQQVQQQAMSQAGIDPNQLRGGGSQ